MTVLFFKMYTMNLEINKQSAQPAVGEVSFEISPATRIKTCLTDLSDQSSQLKRFQRSFTNKFQTASSSSQLTHRAQPKILQISLKQNNMIKSVGSQVRLQDSGISKQKFIPTTMRELKIKDTSFSKVEQANKAEQKRSDFEKLYSRIKDSKLEFPNVSQPFKRYHNNSEKQDQLKASLIYIQDKDKAYYSLGDNQNKPGAKIVFDKNMKTNLSTQESIPQHKNNHKLKKAIGSQTQIKKVVAVGSNTNSPKFATIKTQTDETSWSIQKIIDDLKCKIKTVQQQNEKLKKDLTTVNKQKEKLTKTIKDLETINKQNRQTQQTILKNNQLQYKSRNQRSVSMVSEGQSYKQISLQYSLQNLKKEIEILKSGLGVKKIEQVLQNVKRDNISLTSQIQTISLRCRMLEQQNNQYSAFQQQNRKLKTQIKYFRGSIKDHQGEISRLKIQNSKLRNKSKIIAGNNFEDSTLFSAWGSQTDSLNLSVSFIRD